MNLLTCYYIDLYRDTLRNLDRKQTIIVLTHVVGVYANLLDQKKAFT